MLRRAVVVAALVALAGAGEAAAAAPSATTGPVTAVGPTTATVSGTVNPNGTSTTWYVEYGTTTSYGSKTTSASAGSGTTSVAVSPTITGLKAGTTYHYRVVATNSAGTAHGSDGVLTTSAAPQVVTGAATNVTPTSATLNGTVNPSSRSTTWYFEYGTSTSYGTKTPVKDAGSGTSPVGVSATVTGLRSGRLYHFRLVASSDAGTSRGADQTFVWASPPTVATTAASSVKDSSATLHGTVNPNGQATTWYFEYGTTTSYGTKTSVKSLGSGTSASNVSASVNGLAPGTVYHVRLVASNAIGTNNGGDQSFTTTGRPVVNAAAATGVTSNAATLNGSVNPNGHAASWYFQYGLSASYGLQTPTRSSSSTSGVRSVSEAIGGLTFGRTYHFRLVATNSIGTSYSADASFTTAGSPITVSASGTTVVFRHAVTLRGKVASGRADESVALFAQRYASGSFTSLATVLTDPGGTWSLTVRPSIRTTYKAVWSGSTSPTVTVGVRPAVSLRALSGLRFTTHVAASHSFAGRVVQLQRRLLDGRWRTVARARLNARSTAVLRGTRLPRGHSTLRVAISVNQVGGGYLAGFSPWLSYRRR
jgi:hypothetical protein